MKKRFYILLVSREADGTLRKIPIPVRYAYLVAATAVIGLFTITGLAGSYSRMLIKTSHFNQLRQQNQSLKQDYAHLEKQAREKDVQAASLGALANEVSALYGLTAGKLTSMRGNPTVVAAAAHAPLKDSDRASAAVTYFHSVDTFTSLRDTAMSGEVARMLAPVPVFSTTLGRMDNPLLPGHDLILLGDEASTTPTLWPITGPITSSFGEREDPILGGGEGEFHPGMDISAPLGTPVHATADGVVISAQMENGYGRMVRIDHGHGVTTGYGHMSGFAVTGGQSISRGQVIGYVGHSGRATGNHVHYEVRIRNTAVNPHKYLRSTLAELGTTPAPTL